MDRDVEMSMENQHTLAIIKAVGRIVITACVILGVSGYACEREDAKATANKPPCKAYVCTDK